MLEEGKSVLPKESGQPDEDDFATVPLANKVAKIKFPKPSEVTSLQVRATSGLASEDTALVTATFVKPDGTTTTKTFKGSPEEEGSPLTIPVDPKFVPLKEVSIKIKITDEDDEVKETKAIDVQVKGCVLGKVT